MSKTLAETIAKYIPFAVPLISIAVAIPLVMQKVPPNWWYGFRTRKTLSDPNLWYRANYLGGMGLLYAGVIALLINLMMSMFMNSMFTALLQSAVIVISMTLALVIWAVQMRDL